MLLGMLWNENQMERPGRPPAPVSMKDVFRSMTKMTIMSCQFGWLVPTTLWEKHLTSKKIEEEEEDHTLPGWKKNEKGYY